MLRAWKTKFDSPGLNGQAKRLGSPQLEDGGTKRTKRKAFPLVLRRIKINSHGQGAREISCGYKTSVKALQFPISWGQKSYPV